MQKTDMSDRDDEDIIKNQDTLVRRAWVDRALEVVRRRLDPGREDPVAVEDAAERPPLYVVGSTRKR